MFVGVIMWKDGVALLPMFVAVTYIGIFMAVSFCSVGKRGKGIAPER